MLTNFSNYNINEKVIYNKELSDIIWNKDMTIKEKYREKFLRIATDFYEQLKLKAEIKDIQLTGSMAQYNYTVSSDFDVHVIINFTDINKDKELVKELVDAKRFIWNTKHNITIKGHEVELYIQDEDEPHTSSGLYSLLKDEWVKKPHYNKPYVDDKYIDLKYNNILQEIERLESKIDNNLTHHESENYYNMTNELIKKIITQRKDALSIGGEFSIDNLVFKKIRSSGKFKKLFDLSNKFYDKIFIQ
jgi:predicted nucleotidyltransferase